MHQRKQYIALAFLASLGSVAATAARAEAQQIVTTVCVACHGEGGNSVVPMFPRLAGLQAEYIEKQLKDFLSNKRKSEVMMPAIANVKESDAAGLAAYYAAQKPQKGEVKDEKRAAAGKVLFDDGNTTTGVPACSGCHQAGGVGNERYPRLAGQHQEYTSQQMLQFKEGGRNNDKGKVMRAVASRLTEQEIADLSEYLAGL